MVEKPGRATLEVFAEVLPVIIRSFPWPKSMRWGERSAGSGRAALGAAAALDRRDIRSGDRRTRRGEIRDRRHPAGNVTFGHRFMAPAAISVRRFDDYEAKLKAAKSCSTRRRRKDIILADAKQLAFAQGFELVEDQALLDEVAGLVEWPVVLMGSFDKEFLSIPGEVIRATIRNNQKCFVVSDPKTGKLTNKFILIANIEATDGGKAIIAGNERVIRARLSDAKFFYESDLKTQLEVAAAEIRSHRVPREARHARRAHQAHREACRRDRAAGRRRCREGQARRASGQGGFVHRSGRRIPGTAGLDGEILRAGAGRGRVRRRRERGALQAAGARAIACRPIRWRSPWRLPTRSIRWSVSGRSMKSRRGARTRMRCAVLRWA